MDALTDLPAARAAAVPDRLEAERARALQALAHRHTDVATALAALHRQLALVRTAATPEAIAAAMAQAPLHPGMLVPADEPAEIEELAVRFRSHERMGGWRMPRLLRVRAFCGNVELDLTHAAIAPGVSGIALDTLFANVELTVPADVRVECPDRLQVSRRWSGGTTTRGAVLALTGRARWSNVEVRTTPPRPERP